MLGFLKVLFFAYRTYRFTKKTKNAVEDAQYYVNKAARYNQKLEDEREKL